MKNLLLILLCAIIPIVGNSQVHENKVKNELPPQKIYLYTDPDPYLFTISYLQWSDHGAFMLSRSPLITGYGTYSDSLSKLYQGKTFYESNGEYYPIESWADYYYWFTKKYWFKFNNPELYEYYYLSNNDYAMASYIVSRNFLGNWYPSLIRIDFLDLKIELNRLADERYFADQKRKIEMLRRDLEQEPISERKDLPEKSINLNEKSEKYKELEQNRERTQFQKPTIVNSRNANLIQGNK